MLKKSLIAIATLGAFAGSAMAADITISGRIDTGLNYHWNKVTDTDPTADTVKEDTFGMKSGQYSGSRITIKGSEELGNGMKAGFVLENGFEGDDGSFDSNGDDKLFGREAIVYLEGDFGHFSMGREGALTSGVGSYNLVYGYLPYGAGWGSYAGSKGEFMIGDRSRFNNTLTYRSPSFAGVQVYAQYSLEADAQEDDQSGNNKRYAALGATYNVGAFSTALVVDTVMNGNDDASANKEDSLGVSWGASYDFGVTKPMIMVQYGKNENKFAGFANTDFNEVNKNDAERTNANEGLKGFAVALGAVTPLFGGNLYTTVQYADGEFDGDVLTQSTSIFNKNNTPNWDNPSETGRVAGDVQRWGVTVGYDYPLSKRTKLYGFAAYNEGEFKYTEAYTDTQTGTTDSLSGKEKQKDIEAGVGLIHYF